MYGEMIRIRQRWSMRSHMRKCKKADKILCTHCDKKIDVKEDVKKLFHDGIDVLMLT